MSARDRVRAPRDTHAAPPRLDREDAEAAARRILAGYVRQQQGTTRAVAGAGRMARVVTVVGLGLVGAALGALVGTLRGQPLAFGAALAAVGLLLGWITARR